MSSPLWHGLLVASCKSPCFADRYFLQLMIFCNCLSPIARQSYKKSFSIADEMQSGPNSDPCFVGHNLTHAVSLGEFPVTKRPKWHSFGNGNVQAGPHRTCSSVPYMSNLLATFRASTYYHFAIEAQSCSFIDEFIHVYAELDGYSGSR